MDSDAKQNGQQPRGDVPVSQVLEWVIGLDRQEVANKQTWNSDTLWARWRRYCQVQDDKDPPEPAVMSGFCLFVGLSTADLRVFTEKGPKWARVVKRIELECVERIERRLIRGQGSAVGCIFWLKNRAAWRDKSPDELADDREDWLTRLQKNVDTAQRRAHGHSEPGTPPTDTTDRLLELDGDDSGILHGDFNVEQDKVANE